MKTPLAYQLRPTNISEVVGQEHLIGEGKILNRMIKAKLLSSMILYGPPGIGKTSIASAIAGSTGKSFRVLNAATCTKKDLEMIVEESKISGSVVLMLDEIHRLDRTKQDFLLTFLERGSIVLVGATTENPYININPALRSRIQIFELKPLSQENIKKLLSQAINNTNGDLGKLNIKLDSEAIDFLSISSNGDARNALNALELAVYSSDNLDKSIHITLEIAKECFQQKSTIQDKNGDAHYDVISAFQKSIRGSDTDAALHYMARLIDSGDLQSIIRRLLVIAYEDIGLANPGACERAATSVLVAEKLGLPEARIPLADAVIELSISPKSNSGISAINSSLDDLKNQYTDHIPEYLKDSHHAGAKLRSQKYKYPHDYKNNWIAQQYLPNKIKNSSYYAPQQNSNFEIKLGEQYKKIKQQQKNNLKK